MTSLLSIFKSPAISNALLSINIHRRLWVAGGFLLSLYCIPVFSSQPIVIVNRSVSVDQIPLKELRAIFTMKKRFWKEGEPISVFVLSNEHSVHKRFCKQALNIFPHQLETVWYRLVYTGTGKAPIEAGSEAEMQKKVANTPGAIGYIEVMSDDKKTKILTVN